MPIDKPRILFGYYFYPIGGSAYVLRAILKNFPGWDIQLFTGASDETMDFFVNDSENITVYCHNYSPAAKSKSPMDHYPPNLGSPRDKGESAPDFIWSKLNDYQYDLQVRAWEEFLSRADKPDLICLYHLTPMHQAAINLWPDVPLVTHMHGHENAFIETRNSHPYYDVWRERMISWGKRSDLIFVSPGNEERIEKYFPETPYRVIANGFYPQELQRQNIDRREFWRRVLVGENRGLNEKGEPMNYTQQDIAPILSLGNPRAPIFMASGRFLQAKQFPMMIEAWKMAEDSLPDEASLILLGGFPGEVEGEHPLAAAKRVRAKNFFLAGWLDNSRMADIFSAIDVFLLPSKKEYFGMVLLEAAACQVPALAVSAPGPDQLIVDEESGLLVGNSLSEFAAGISRINSMRDRWPAMGQRARDHVIKRFSQEAINNSIAESFLEIID